MLDKLTMEVGVSAATDITGFGLLGHLHEMAAGSGVAAEIKLSKVPVLPEAWELIKDDVAPGGSHRNRTYLSSVVEWDDGITFDEQLMLCDAQTSGGMLISLPHRKSKKLEQALQSRGVAYIVPIGRIVETGDRGVVRIAR